MTGKRPWVLVTGGAKRLGRVVAMKAAAQGWNVAIHYASSAKDAETTATEVRALGGNAVLVSADLMHQADSLIGEAAALAGAPLTALVNCAAIFDHDVAETFTPELAARHMRVNTYAPVTLANALAAQLPADASGAVVNFLDYKLAQPYPDHFSYTLSKYALAGATELLARALAPRVRVNAVAPAYVLPSPGQSDADFQRLHADTPLERGASPEDAAAAALYLLEAPAVTGQTIYVDAGLRFRSRDKDFAFS
ncbi:MAG: SDR family oxidoreductase [Alphaproteobacteria bacterium]|nr:SDR family oxidoreductase [Alphaproteobacteria bacterium]